VTRTTPSSPVGLHRVIEPSGTLPQAATKLDASPEIWPDEVRVSVSVLNLDAASFRQLITKHEGDGEQVKREVLQIVADRGKMQNPVTGSGGMLVGTVDAVGPEASLDVQVGQQITTLVSLSLTPLVITDGLARWDGRSEQVPCEGHAILFGRTIAATGAPALTARVVRQYVDRGDAPTVAVIGGAGKSGSLSLAAARDSGARRTVGIVPVAEEAALLAEVGLADVVSLADARDPVVLAAAVAEALDGPADITVVCVDVPGCEHGAILSTSPEGGTVIFFSMATSFSAAALGAEGLAADTTMLIGNGYTPGHADYTFDLLRRSSGVRELFTRRLDAEGTNA
jgi:L-erythro-3,5-diaminohexanoate dehydrogenase